MAAAIEIFVGTSQDFLLSFKVKTTDDDEFALERFIAHRCHNGPIICMAKSGKYLATGGGDDRIVIIDLKLNRDVYEIMRHEGSINSVLFTNQGSDLLSGSEDGRLIATNVGSWKPVSIWKKPHTGKGVLKVCLHQSDKFAMTLGKDGTLRTWDMFKGTQINTFNTKEMSKANIVLDNIELSPNGNTLAISGAKTVTFLSLSGEETPDELTLKSRVTSMCWLDDENLLIGMENGSIEWKNIDTSEHVNLPNIHTKRIKGMHHLNGFLGTICSTGNVSLWATTVSNKKLSLICTATDDSMRPTCIKLIDITENRYKEPLTSNADVLKESLPRSAKITKPISTTGKLIVEMNGIENQINGNLKVELPPDNAITTNVVKTSAKKSTKKKVTSSSKVVVTTTTTTSTINSNKNTATLSKKKTGQNTVTKSTIVRSLNSDDDVELERRRSKKKNIVVTMEEPETEMETKSNSKQTHRICSHLSVANSQKNVNSASVSIADEKPVREKKIKATRLSCPTFSQENESSQRSTKKRRKFEHNHHV